MTSSESSAPLWAGRFEKAPSRILQEYGASIEVDKRLWKEDIAGSQAHARMLAKQGIISQTDCEAILSGLDQVSSEIESGNFSFNVEDEDIHMAIESRLTSIIGDAGKRLHTGRSRNDQVALDTHLACKRLAGELHNSLIELMDVLYQRAQRDFGLIIPGYTHLQRAQPVLFSHHLLAYFWMFSRDAHRAQAAHDAADVSPLGSAALAGTTYPLDRGFVADQVGLSSITANSLDAVSDRDYLVDLIYACTLTQVHLSRLCEEIVLWSTGEFGFITLSDEYSTGSSIMPQKKNPDFAELTRGKTGRAIGNLVGILTALKSLPLAYNKDLQEDKEFVFDSVDTVMMGIFAVKGMIETMATNPESMRIASHGGFMAATDLADYLVGKGVPFRNAHEISGSLVLACEKQGRTLQDLTLEDLKAASEYFEDDVMDALSIDKIVAKRTTPGGTGHEAVKEQIIQAGQTLEHLKTAL